MALHCGPPNEMLRCGLPLDHQCTSDLFLINVGCANLKQKAGHSSHKTVKLLVLKGQMLSDNFNTSQFTDDA